MRPRQRLERSQDDALDGGDSAVFSGFEFYLLPTKSTPSYLPVTRAFGLVIFQRE